jgi:DNA (cytosine-5)-methyltransferase 1
MGIIVDLFAGGGGASQGIFEALGRHPDIAVNHNAMAVAIHAANHPDTRHFCQDVWSVDPAWVSQGQPVDLLWASPDCTHHSKAKGGPPRRDEKRRDLALVISHKWVPALKPNLLILENVEEFQDWGPCDSSGIPVAAARGENFRAFVNSLRKQGYQVEWRELSACDYGAPTTRKRLFLMARSDGRPIVWPEPTHGAPDSSDVKAGMRKSWRTAAEIIDWSLPCPSIFASSKEIWNTYGLRSIRPLKENTLRRIFKGLKRYVLDSPEPFIVNLAHTRRDGSYDCFRGVSLGESLPTVTLSPGLGVVAPYIVTNTSGHAPHAASSPLSTITTGGQQVVAAPYLVGAGGPFRAGEPVKANKPLGAVLTRNTRAVVTPFLQHVQHSKAKNGVMPADEPLRTITAAPKGGGMALVSPYLVREFGHSTGAACTAPAPVVMATGGGKSVLLAPFLTSYHGAKNENETRGKRLPDCLPTQTTENRFGLVAPFLVKNYSGVVGKGINSPIDTVTTIDHHTLVSPFIAAEADDALPGFKYRASQVAAFLDIYAGNATHEANSQNAAFRTDNSGKADHTEATVRFQGETFIIVDIGMRMLAPSELLLAQGFPASYALSEINGKKIPKSAQIAMIGNSVCPPLAKALVAANYAVSGRADAGAGKPDMPFCSAYVEAREQLRRACACSTAHNPPRER